MAHAAVVHRAGQEGPLHGYGWRQEAPIGQRCRGRQQNRSTVKSLWSTCQRPQLHTYLHAIESTTNVEPAYSLDRRRLDDTLGRFGAIPFGQGQALLSEGLRNLADALKRLQILSTPTAAHEFGHMVGLIDEYYGAASSESVKAMISAGFLPPDTRGDHLKLNASKDASEKANQKATEKVLKRTGLESPDFAIDAPRSRPKTTSLMTGGFEVTPVHLITAWEALVAMTGAYVNEKYWRIS